MRIHKGMRKSRRFVGRKSRARVLKLTMRFCLLVDDISCGTGWKLVMSFSFIVSILTICFLSYAFKTQNLIYLTIFEFLFPSEAKYEAIDMKKIFYSHENKTHFYKKGFGKL